MNRRFIFHGSFLLVVGILSVIYNPHTGLLGFNPEAKSGLIVSGAFAVISFFWAFIYSRQAERVAVIGGFVTTLLLFAGTIPASVRRLDRLTPAATWPNGSPAPLFLW